MDIQTLRSELGLSLRAMGAELGISGQAVHQLEAGGSEPSIRTAWRYVDVAESHGYELTLEDIFPRGDGS